MAHRVPQLSHRTLLVLSNMAASRLSWPLVFLTICSEGRKLWPPANSLWHPPLRCRRLPPTADVSRFIGPILRRVPSLVFSNINVELAPTFLEMSPQDGFIRALERLDIARPRSTARRANVCPLFKKVRRYLCVEAALHECRRGSITIPILVSRQKPQGDLCLDPERLGRRANCTSPPMASRASLTPKTSCQCGFSGSLELRLRVGTFHPKALRQLRQGMGRSQQDTVDCLGRLILTLSDQIHAKLSS